MTTSNFNTNSQCVAPESAYGLIFDVDGVIADTEAVNARASIQVFADLFGVRGVQRQDFEAGLGRGAAAYVLAAAQVHGLTLSPDQIAAASEARQQYFLQMLADDPLPAFPGVLDLLQAAMNDAAFGVAIATSSTREKSEAVLRSARAPYPDLVYISGSEVTHKKPHPELFLLAAAGIGLPPERCVVIEDAPNGVQAAKAAGCACIAVTNSVPAQHLTQADRIITALTELTLSDLKALID